MTATDAATTSASDERTVPREAGADDMRVALALLVLWMVSVLGFACLLVTVFADLPLALIALPALVWLGPGLLAAPLMLYDAWSVREAPAAAGFRFDPFWTGVAMLVIYPLGLPVYLMTRLQGSYIAAMGVDTDGMSFWDEFEFGLDDLVNPTSDGVPAFWPAVMVVFGWSIALMGDGGLVLAGIRGSRELVFVAVGIALVARLIATPFLLFDVYLVSKTAHFSRREAVGLVVATTLLYPIAAVGYLPYRLHATYGR